jgi:SAM-dependent methyltransferase
LQLESCPCDLHFVEYLEKRGVEGKSIFHFGTGEHHLVGMRNHERGNPNEVFAITASRQEYRVYIDFIIDNPQAANYYKVMFADIYTLSPSLLPSFDIVTLFHLCEYYDENAEGSARFNPAYARTNDHGLLGLFLSRLNPGGQVVFFKNSGGFISKRGPGLKVLFTKSNALVEGDRRGAEIINDYLSRGEMVIEDEYKTLLICGRPDADSQLGGR